MAICALALTAGTSASPATGYGPTADVSSDEAWPQVSEMGSLPHCKSLSVCLMQPPRHSTPLPVNPATRR